MGPPVYSDADALPEVMGIYIYTYIYRRPGGVSGYPRAWYRSVFREFESPRVHTRTNSCGLFLVHKLTCRKRESVS